MKKGFGELAILTAAIAGVGLSMAVAQAQEERIAFPTNYATEYSNYLSLDRLANDGQIMRIFGNDIAMQGPGEDGRLADGAIIVGEIYAALKDDDGNVILSELGRRIRGDLAAVAVMEKRDGWGDDFADEVKNDDWDFALFGADGTRRDTDLDSCRACHSPLDGIDHVFSFQHLPAAALYVPAAGDPMGL